MADYPSSSSSNEPESKKSNVVEASPQTQSIDEPSKKDREQSYVKTKLRNIVLWVAIAASSVGINLDNAVDYVLPPPPPPPIVLVVPPQAPQETRNVTDDFRRVLKDFADDRISLEQATQEVIRILERIVPTGEELNERVKQILQKAKEKGTQRAWAAALNEILQLIQFMGGGSTPTPTPTVNTR